MNPLLKAINLSCGYEKNIFLKDLNFEIKRGELICLMGPNACGKTTLLKSMGGLKKYYGGNIYLAGKNLLTFKRKELARHISYLLSSKLALSQMTVFDLLKMGRSPYSHYFGKLTEADFSLIERVIDDTGIRPFKNKEFDQLSDGQKQIVLLARTLVQDTPLLILDEPSTFLDIGKKMEMVKILKTYCQKYHKGIIFSSHDWDLVLAMAHKVWIFKQGEKLLQTTPEGLILKDLVVHYFGHSSFKFSKETGLFIEKKPFFNKIYMINKNANKYQISWTAHALEKRNYQVILISKESEISKGLKTAMEIYKDYWIFKNKKYFSLEELLESICSIAP